MKFEVINKELKIAACGVADLTIAQVNSFLELYGDGSSIGTLTLFYDNQSGYVVLNRDNEEYSHYLEISEKYLLFDERSRREVRDKAPNGLKQAFLVLNNALIFRETKKKIGDAV